MRLIDYLDIDVDVVLKAGDEFVLSCDPKAKRILVYDVEHGYAMLDGNIIASPWADSRRLSDFNKKVDLKYIKIGCESKVLKPGDVIHYDKNTHRTIVKLGECKFGLLNNDNYTINVVFDTRSSVGISKSDFDSNNMLIGPYATVTLKGE